MTRTRILLLLLSFSVLTVQVSAQQYTTETYRAEGEELAKVWDERASGLNGPALAKKLATEFTSRSQQDFWGACQALLFVRLGNIKVKDIRDQLPAREKDLFEKWGRWYSDRYDFEGKRRPSPPSVPAELPRPGRGIATMGTPRRTTAVWTPPSPKYNRGSILEWTGATDGVLLVGKLKSNGEYDLTNYYPGTDLGPRSLSRDGAYLARHCRAIGKGRECDTCLGYGYNYQETRTQVVYKNQRSTREHSWHTYSKGGTRVEGGRGLCKQCDGWGVLFE